MAIVGFNFSKIKAEKKSNPKGKININNNVVVLDVKEANFGLDDSKKGVKVEVEFTTQYDPNIGSVVLVGEVLLLETADKAKELIDSWKKDKKMEEIYTAAVLNLALTKCNIQALILSQLINLPSPVPLPKVKVQEPKKE